jgi:3-hydroxyisobutyrate dehydrogenase-like beta-hydroxyacid dehydrogenase
MRVGILGLGLIGRAVGARLVAAGHEVTGFDPVAGEFAGRVAAAAEVWQAEVVIVAVFDAGQAREALQARPEGCAPDVMVMTTCDPEGIASLVPLAGHCGLVEAPVSGTSAQLARGEAVLWLAGDETAVARVMPVAGALGRVVRLGAFGEGARVKLCVNLVLGLNRAALAEGMLLAEALGIAGGRFLDLAQGSAAASAVMATKGPKMAARDFAPEGRVAQSAKDFGLILKAAEGAGVGLPFAHLYAGMMGKLVAAGEGELDNAAIIRALERDRGSPVVAGEV